MKKSQTTTYSERVPRPTNYVAEISVNRTVEGIELACRRTQKDRIAPSSLPASRSGAGNTGIASLIDKGHAPAFLQTLCIFFKVFLSSHFLGGLVLMS